MPPLLSPSVEPGALKRSITVRPQGWQERSPAHHDWRVLSGRAAEEAAPSEKTQCGEIRHLIENLKP